VTQTLLFAGTGGAGTSSISAAAALAAARDGRRVLLMSLAASDGIGDLLADDVAALAAGLTTPSGGTLRCFDADGQALAERAWPAAGPVLASLLKVNPSELPVAEELPGLPPVQDLLMLLALHDVLLAGSHDLVVIDAGTVERALQLLSLPGTVSWLARRFFPMHRRIARALRPVTPRISGLPTVALLGGLDKVDAALAETARWLADPAKGSTQLVVSAEAAPLARAKRALPAFALYGHRIDSVLVNKVWPEGELPVQLSACRDDQRNEISVWQSAVAPIPVLQIELGLVVSPGVAGLAQWGQEIWPDAGALVSPTSLTGEGDSGTVVVGRRDDGFELVLSLPAVERDQISLARREDDLVVTVGAYRRQLDLPPTLRRCVVAGAALENGKLTVQFQPDPALWMTG
jgi:arsenite-transporting ATPase